MQRPGCRSWHAVAFVAAIIAANAVHALELRDDRGVAVHLSAPAARIVTLAPNLTELAFAAGAGERLVGVARFSDFPAEARRLPQIGDAARVDPERILALAPDLVLAWRGGNQGRDIERLESLGLPVFAADARTLNGVSRLLRAVGTLAGTEAAAEHAATHFEEEIAALRARYSRRTPVRVFYEIWNRPLLTVNGQHVISDVIKLCGGINVFAGTPALTPYVSLEAVLAARPEVILGGGSAMTAADFAAQWRGARVPLFRDVPVFYVPPDEIQRATPRIAEGAKAICDALEKVRARLRHVSRRPVCGSRRMAPFNDRECSLMRPSRTTLRETESGAPSIG